MISSLTLNTHNSVIDLLNLDWGTFKFLHKEYVDLINAQNEEAKKRRNQRG
jgi:hypothetical protein